MSLTRTTCPTCGAGLKSAAGFDPGQQVRCPKCSTAFAVPAPAFEAVEDDPPAGPKRKGPPARAARDDDDGDRPRRRRRPRDDDDDDDDDRPRKKGKKTGGYKNSPLRFAVLGVLLVVLGVLAYMLYVKRQKEREDAGGPNAAGAGDDDLPPAARTRVDPNQRDPRIVPAIAGGGGNQGKAGPGNPGKAGPGDGGKAGPSATADRKATNDLRQIMIGMLNHADANGGKLPKAAITGPDGKALLSWRVALLPYIEQQNLYKEFKLDEPWDSPANKKQLQYMPRTYQGSLPAAEGKTAFKVFVGNGAAFDLRQGRAMSGVPDGTSNTFGVVETGPPVEWTKPEDIPFDGKALPPLSPLRGDVLLAGMLDGSVRRLSLTRNPPDVLLKGVTAAGGEPVQFEE